MTPSRLDRTGRAGTQTSGRGTHVTARCVARFHDAYVSALWRGKDVSAITSWLEAHWTYKGPPEPDDPPDAVSLLGGAAIGENRIRWYQNGEVVYGYQSGRRRGCYRLPVTESLPTLAE